MKINRTPDNVIHGRDGWINPELIKFCKNLPRDTFEALADMYIKDTACEGQLFCGCYEEDCELYRTKSCYECLLKHLKEEMGEEFVDELQQKPKEKSCEDNNPVTVREFVKKLLDCDLDSEVIIHANTRLKNQRATVIGDTISKIYNATGEPYKTYTIIETEFSPQTDGE